MGLDLVEMVYRIEEEFEITIPDEAAEKMVAPEMLLIIWWAGLKSAKNGQEIM